MEENGGNLVGQKRLDFLNKIKNLSVLRQFYTAPDCSKNGQSAYDRQVPCKPRLVGRVKGHN